MQALHLQVETALDMPRERLQRLDPVSALDDPDKLHVIAKRLREIDVLDGGEQGKRPGPGPDDIKHFQKETVSRAHHEGAVDVAVGLEVAARRPVLKTFLPLDRLAEPGDVVRRIAHGQNAGALPLDAGAGLIEFPDLTVVHAVEPETALVGDLQNAFLLQAHERLADGCPADVHLVRELFLHKPVIRPEFPTHDRLDQLVVNLVRQSAASWPD